MDAALWGLAGLNSLGQKTNPVKVHISAGLSSFYAGPCFLPPEDLGHGVETICQ